MLSPTTVAGAGHRPYWLYGFEEICRGCEHVHAHAVEIRCVSCDGPFCPICVIYMRAEPFCRECVDEGEGD